MLTDLQLWKTVNKVDQAIGRLREFEPEDGYYLAYSGGKDSTVLLALARLAGIRFDAHYSVTTVDPPELVRFIRHEEPDVIWDRPDYTMWQLIVRHGMPPTRRVRYCCRELKEDKGVGRVVLTGIRAEEGSARGRRSMVESCYRVRKRYVHPIIDWLETDIWEFIKKEGLPYCRLYDEGFHRLGCIMCPMKRRRRQLRDAARWPKYRMTYVRAFDRMLSRRRQLGKATTWNSGQDAMTWWLSDHQAVPETQLAMFA